MKIGIHCVDEKRENVYDDNILVVFADYIKKGRVFEIIESKYYSDSTPSIDDIIEQSHRK